MLPPELPEELKNVAVHADLSGDRYGVLFFDRPIGNTVKRYVHTNEAGSFTASPEPQETPEYLWIQPMVLAQHGAQRKLGIQRIS
jgi:hypothetical protein